MTRESLQGANLLEFSRRVDRAIRHALRLLEVVRLAEIRRAARTVN